MFEATVADYQPTLDPDHADTLAARKSLVDAA